jgi:hypothetical protein
MVCNDHPKNIVASRLGFYCMTHVLKPKTVTLNLTLKITR